MNLFPAGVVAIVLQIVLLLIWAYSIFLKPNGTDPAGRGIAMGFFLALGAYIAIGALLLLTRRFWPMVAMLVMAALPIIIVGVGLWKEYGNAKR